MSNASDSQSLQVAQPAHPNLAAPRNAIVRAGNSLAVGNRRYRSRLKFGRRAKQFLLFWHFSSGTPFTTHFMIHVRNLTKSYADLRRGQFVALDDISFDVVPGQIYGLLGPNGAGKTTALRILSTMLRPTRGTATVNSFDVCEQPEEVRRQIGFMSANTAVYDRMTAWEMVEYFGRLHGLQADELRERMEQLFSRLQMNEIRDLLGSKMSTGMKQKVSIARAMVHDPPVVIFDEATNGLDVLVARALLKTVAELRDHGKCIIFSTHIMREAEKLCDRIAIIHRGKILAEGMLAELREQYEQHDLEELFFSLITDHDDAHLAASR
jgi:sodium transport system ATP-binding protein